ncbi:trans-sulfuration enzyme family protein [Arsenicicoccus sp. oral taxon 190]|uniref:trans-sulfuration enzyme family protein n=1 Tax=Arsenicicoccus sp. oral taxon 190 TaxID=1658671 RepID=UPI000679FD17|nr:PLP-dependent transferase [Arsenicicoccus sp. oral taxon 190]AKT52914.1 cystathionine gamma-synthase [Arsenicicoccus sp. oral taxon 190]
MSDHWSPATRAVALGRPPHAPGAPVNPPLELSTTYVAGGDRLYARVGNRTWDAFEETLGSLEGGSALAFASGMAAVCAALDLAPHGGVVVAPDGAYNTTVSLLDSWVATGRLAEVRRVDPSDASAVARATRGADLVWLESPTNPLLVVADVATVAHVARSHGAISVCDNTFATPILQQPLDLGVDVVVHSATKYLAGHSDVLLGATVTRDAAIEERLHTHRTLTGGVPGPHETWLALRGIRTLALRVERSGDNARVLAERLGAHPAVTRVRYPGWGAIVSVEVGSVARADALSRGTRLWTHATSLGGVESLLERRRRHANEPAVVPEDLVRLSVGIEDVEDLWADLRQALDALA